MRISDWSSDVCSSDLNAAAFLAPAEILARQHYETLRTLLAGLPVNLAVLTRRDKGRARDRKSVASGKSESVRVNIGSGRINKKTKQRKTKQHHATQHQN